MITYTALATALDTNAAAVAAAAGVTQAQVEALGELLLIMAQDKDKGLPPLLRTQTAKTELNAT